MADNVTADAGAGGATFRTDDDGTAHWPYTKLAWGADNTQTIVAAGASAIPVQDGGNSLTVDNGGTFAVQVSGVATEAKQPALGTAGTASTDVISVQGIAAMTPLLVTASAGTNLNTSALALEAGGNLAAAATSLAVLDDWDESDRAKVNPIVGQAGVQGGGGTITALTQRVVLASDQTALTVPLSTKELRCATGTLTQVADNAASVTVLASNAARIGASVQNDSSAVLYLKMGSTASATDYSVRMVQYAYFEVPFGYTGIITGIWASDPGDGAARVTEYT